MSEKIKQIVLIKRAPAFNRIKDTEIAVRPPRSMGFAGRFVVEQIHGPTGIVKRRLEFDNVITNAGLDLIGTGGNLLTGTNFAAVGTDNTTPSESDTTLGAQVGPRTSTVESGGGFTSGPDFRYWQRVQVRQFPQGAIEGNIAEVGMFSASTGGTMWCRQLFPETLVFTTPNEDILRVIYTLRIYLGIGDPDDPEYFDPLETVVSINGVNTSCLHRAYDVDNSGAWGQTADGIWRNSALTGNTAATGGATLWESGDMPSLPDAQTGSSLNVQNNSWGTYSAGSFVRDRTVTAGTSQANFGSGFVGSVTGWMGAASGNVANWRFRIVTFNPRIPKDNTRVLSITERISWGRQAFL